MAIGIQPTKADLDSAMGALSRDIRINLRPAADFKTFFDQYTAAQIESTFGYTAGDGANIKSAFADLKKLDDIFHGLDTQTPAYDFTTFAKKLWGTGGAY